MYFGLFKDSGRDFKRSELLYAFIQNLAGVIRYYKLRKIFVENFISYSGLWFKIWCFPFQKSIPHPISNGDLVYKLRRVGAQNNLFPREQK